MTVADRIARDGPRQAGAGFDARRDLRAAELQIRRRVHRQHQSVEGKASAVDGNGNIAYRGHGSRTHRGAQLQASQYGPAGLAGAAARKNPHLARSAGRHAASMPSQARSTTSAISATRRSITPSCPRARMLRTQVANATRLVERPISWEDKVWLSWDRRCRRPAEQLTGETRMAATVDKSWTRWIPRRGSPTSGC